MDLKDFEKISQYAVFFVGKPEAECFDPFRDASNIRIRGDADVDAIAQKQCQKCDGFCTFFMSTLSHSLGSFSEAFVNQKLNL